MYVAPPLTEKELRELYGSTGDYKASGLLGIPYGALELALKAGFPSSKALMICGVAFTLR